MKEMSKNEISSFLAQGTLTAKVSTINKDGSCHTVPVWFIRDGEDILFTTGQESAKARNLENDNRITLCVDDQKPPFSFIMIYGTATIIRCEPDELFKWTSKIAGRYMGNENAEEYGKRNAAQGELLMRIRSDKVIAHKNVAE